jgi:hypothetical protein
MRIDREASTGVPHQSSTDVLAMAAYAPSSLGSMLREDDATAQTLAIAAVQSVVESVRSHLLRPTKILELILPS